MILNRLLPSDMPEDEKIGAMGDVWGTAMWIAIFLYKLYSICHCFQTTSDEVGFVKVF